MKPVVVFDCPEVIYWASNAYAVQFSPDGTCLAIGSGGWYGHGGLTLVDLASSAQRTLRFGERLPPESAVAAGSRVSPRFTTCLTVSGVCFDDRGRYLAISTWSGRQRSGPGYLYRVRGLDLERVQRIEGENGLPRSGPATGLCFTPGQLHIRSLSLSLNQIFTSWPMPEDLDGRGAYAWRAHARMAVVEGALYTGGGGSRALREWHSGHGILESHKAGDGLVSGPAPYRVFPAPVERITAVVAAPDGRLYTGGLGGEIHAWSRRGDTWKPERALTEGGEKPPRLKTAWGTYHPQSVVGLCVFDDGRLCSVDADGEVSVWYDGRREARTQIPVPGTPRAIAAHPSTPVGPLLAIGMKAGDDVRRGTVVCLAW